MLTACAPLWAKWGWALFFQMVSCKPGSDPAALSATAHRKHICHCATPKTGFGGSARVTRLKVQVLCRSPLPCKYLFTSLWGLETAPNQHCSDIPSDHQKQNVTKTHPNNNSVNHVVGKSGDARSQLASGASEELRASRPRLRCCRNAALLHQVPCCKIIHSTCIVSSWERP